MMSADETETGHEDVVVECEMEVPPETVWRALTEEALTSDWLGAWPEADGDGVVQGRRYRIVEAEPVSRVRYAWHDPDCPDAPPLVTVELEPLAGGRTWFRLTHGRQARQMQAANTNGPLALAA